MKTFAIYRSDAGEFRAVQYGFAFPALFLQWIWLLYKALYFRGTLFFLAYWFLGNLIYGTEARPTLLENGLLGFIPMLQHQPLIESEILRISAGLFRTLAFGIIIGAFGNKWHRTALLTQGFVHVMNCHARVGAAAIERVRTRALPITQVEDSVGSAL